MHLPSGEVHKITKNMHFPETSLCTGPKLCSTGPNLCTSRPIMHFPGREVHNLTKLCTRIRPVSGGPEKQREQATITTLREYFTLGGCAGPEMQIHRTSHNNSCEREYFTLGGCASLEMQIHRTSHNNSFERICLFGRVCWSWKETPYEQATITAVRENISLWEGVLVLKGHCIRAERASHNNSCEREYFSLGGCAGPGRPLYTSRESKPQ